MEVPCTFLVNVSVSGRSKKKHICSLRRASGDLVPGEMRDTDGLAAKRTKEPRSGSGPPVARKKWWPGEE